MLCNQFIEPKFRIWPQKHHCTTTKTTTNIAWQLGFQRRHCPKWVDVDAVGTGGWSGQNGPKTRPPSPVSYRFTLRSHLYSKTSFDVWVSYKWSVISHCKTRCMMFQTYSLRSSLCPRTKAVRLCLKALAPGRSRAWAPQQIVSWLMTSVHLKNAELKTTTFIWWEKEPCGMWMLFVFISRKMAQVERLSKYHLASSAEFNLPGLAGWWQSDTPSGWGKEVILAPPSWSGICFLKRRKTQENTKQRKGTLIR